MDEWVEETAEVWAGEGKNPAQLEVLGKADHVKTRPGSPETILTLTLKQPTIHTSKHPSLQCSKYSSQIRILIIYKPGIHFPWK